MSGRYVMALDAGTGSGRAVIYDLRGRVVGLGQEEWVHRPVPGVQGGLEFETTRNGPLMDRAIAKAMDAAGIEPDAIAAVSTTSMREGMVLYDRDGAVLWACPNIDARAQAEACLLRDEGLADRIFHTAGDWVSLTSPGRFKWLAHHEPRLMERVARIGLISDWLATRLTGEYWTEPSAGSSTALFDLARRQWSLPLIDALDLDPKIFPPVAESGDCIGRVTPAAAELSGLKAGTPVIAGGGDTQLALLGLARNVGDATLVGGSFWQMTILADEALIDPQMAPRTLCHARPGEWMVEGIGFLTGFSLRWLRDAFIEPLVGAIAAGGPASSVFSLMETLAERTPVGSGGVVATMANAMQSDRWIHPAPSLVGFDFGRTEMGVGAAIRAVMEAGAFVSLEHLQTLRRLSGRDFDRLQFTGGSSQGRVWPQIVADVVGLPVDIPAVKETTALGCAILAAKGAGLFADVAQAGEAMASPIERTLEPSLEHAAAYGEAFERWRETSQALTELASRGVVQPMWRPAGARA